MTIGDNTTNYTVYSKYGREIVYREGKGMNNKLIHSLKNIYYCNANTNFNTTICI